MQCYTLNQRTLLLLIVLMAMLLVLSFSVGYYSGLRNAPQPQPSKVLTEELLTAFLEAPAREESEGLEVISELESEEDQGAEQPSTKPETTPLRLLPNPAPSEPEASSPSAVTRAIPEGPAQSDAATQRTVAIENSPTAKIQVSSPATRPTASPAETPVPEPPVQHAPIVGYAVQVGSFSEPRYAEASVKRWRRGGYPAFVYRTQNASGRIWHTVRIGYYARRTEAATMAERLREEEGRQAVTVPLRSVPKIEQEE